MEITIALAIVGLGASILTEIVKLVPAVGQSDALKSLIAIIIVAILAFLTNNMEWSWVSFYAVLAFAFVNYKMLIQPASRALGLSSQSE